MPKPKNKAWEWIVVAALILLFAAAYVFPIPYAHPVAHILAELLLHALKYLLLATVFLVSFLFTVFLIRRKLRNGKKKRVNNPDPPPHEPAKGEHHHKEHDSHSHKKEEDHKDGFWASLGKGVKGLLDALLTLAIALAALAFALWLAFLLGVPGVANWGAKEAGGKGHPQYEERMKARETAQEEDKTMTTQELMVCEPNDSEPSIIRIWRNPGAKMVFSDSTLEKMKQGKVFVSYTMPVNCVGDLSYAAGHNNEYYYFWSASPGETMEFRWSRSL